MRLNPYVYGLMAIAIFLGVIFTAQKTGYWSVSGKISSTGEKVTATGADPEEIKGWMTIGEVSKAYGVPMSELAAQFGLPADTAESKQLKELESDTFSVTSLRTWLAERQKK